MNGRRSDAAAEAAARVRAPVDAALSVVVWRCTLVFAVCVATIAVPILVHLSEGPTLLIRHTVPALLTIDIIVHGWRSLRSRDLTAPGDRSPLEESWIADPSGTRLAVCMIAVAAVAVLAALAALVLPYLADPHDRGIVVAVCFPLGGTITFLAGLSWASETARILTRGLDEANGRFRSYWANIGRGTRGA